MVVLSYHDRGIRRVIRVGMWYGVGMGLKGGMVPRSQSSSQGRNKQRRTQHHVQHRHIMEYTAFNLQR